MPHRMDYADRSRCRGSLAPPRALPRTGRRSFWVSEHRRASRKPTPRPRRPKSGRGIRSFLFLPEFGQRTALAVHRIVPGHRHLRNRLEGSGAILNLRAFVIGPGRRIGPNDEEVVIGGKTLMAGPGRQDHDVTGLEREDPPLVAAEAHPTVGLEQDFHHGRRIVTVAEIDGVPIDDEGPAGMVGNETVILEPDSTRVSRTRELWSLFLVWAAQPGRPLHVLLHVLKDWHVRPPSIFAADSRSRSATAVPLGHRARSPRPHRWPSAPARRSASAEARAPAPG